jgi:hypothetical protein
MDASNGMARTFGIRAGSALAGLLLITAASLPSSLNAAPGASGLLKVIGSSLPGGGSVGGVVGGAVSATVGGVLGVGAGAAGGLGIGLSGPSSTLSAAGVGGLTPAFASIGSLSGAQTPVFGTRQADVAPEVRAIVALMAREQIVGRVTAVTAGQVQLRTSDGHTQILGLSAGLAAELRPFLGKNVMLRSLDGRNVTEIVGRDETVRGTIVASAGGIVGFVAPTGIVYAASVDPKAAAAMRVGTRLVAVSRDFGRSVTLSLFGLAPASSLADIYVGRIQSANGGRVALRVGATVQTFAADAHLAAQLAALRGHTVALDVPDGIDAKALISTAMLSHLLDVTQHPQHGSRGVAAAVIGIDGRLLTVQLPNGDVRTFAGQTSLAGLNVRAPITIQFLDRAHVRIQTGARVATLADAHLCVTINASCARSEHGRVVALSPTTAIVRFSNGDIQTYLGHISPIGLGIGVPVTLTPLDATHVRIAAGANVANLIQAGACVTINAGCSASVGTISGTGKGNLTVALPGSSSTTLVGAVTNVAVGLPIVVQPLDTTNVVGMVGGQVADLTNATACVAINASCATTSGGSSRIGIPIGGKGPGDNGSGGNGSGGNGTGGNGTGGNGSGGNGTGGAEFPVAFVPLNGVVEMAYAQTSCGDQGQIVASVSDRRTSHAIAGADVIISGPMRADVKTGADGRAIFLALPVGDYTANVRAPRYRSLSAQTFTVGCTVASAVNFSLQSSVLRTPATASRATSSRTTYLNETAARAAAKRSTLCVARKEHDGWVCAKHG